jgi:phage terminase large subunit GpA-like protein
MTLTHTSPQELLASALPEDLSISEWAEKYRVLTEPSAEKGQLRLSRTPYLVPILDFAGSREVETIVLCASAQIAKTEFLISTIGYYSHQEPCPIMFVFADQDTAESMSRDRVQKMYRSSPDLAKLVVEEEFNRGEIRLANGAHIIMGWASSVARLASRPVRIVIFDEVDKPGYSLATEESSAISLGVQRTETFYNRLILMTSTPTTESGNILKHLYGYQKSDGTEHRGCDLIYDWHVPCPECGVYQPLRWGPEFSYGFPEHQYLDMNGVVCNIGSVVWEGGRKASAEQIEAAGYQCGSCPAIWTTQRKDQAVQQGQMVARSEPVGRVRKVGFHLNRLYSLLGRSGNIPKLVEDWLGCFQDPKERQAFVNSALAEPWVQKIQASTEGQILKACCELPAQTVPSEAVALTCGIDCQKYGFWFVVRAWAKDYTSWLVHYGHLATFEDIEQLLFNTVYPSEEGKDHRIWRAALDSGGGDTDEGLTMTEQVYFWVRDHSMGRSCRVWAAKGSSNPIAGAIAKYGETRDKTPSGKPLRGGLQLVLLDVSQLKDTFFKRIENAATGGTWQPAYLHLGTGPEYAQQVTAEEKRRDRRGKVEWVRIRRVNHLLDAEIIAAALADPSWPGGGINLFRPNPRTPERKTWQDDQEKTLARHQSASNPNLSGRTLNPWKR